MEGRSVVELHGQRLPLRSRRSFTLMEALIASAILFAGVLAVISAIMSGQQKAFEAEQQVLATLAAEELMGEVISGSYADLDDLPMFQPLGDKYALIFVTPTTEELPDLDVWVTGSTVQIQIVPSMTDLRPLVELLHFIPEPQS
jgi:Tfp pilus assembly protein PilV